MGKLIVVNEEVYMKLRKLKGKQSFSLAIDKLIESKVGNIGKYFGAWRNRKDLDEIEGEITKSRKTFWAKRRGTLPGV